MLFLACSACIAYLLFLALAGTSCCLTRSDAYVAVKVSMNLNSDPQLFLQPLHFIRRSNIRTLLTCIKFIDFDSHIIRAIGLQKVAFTLPDLSAAFNTIDHYILFECLSSWFEITYWNLTSRITLFTSQMITAIHILIKFSMAYFKGHLILVIYFFNLYSALKSI